MFFYTAEQASQIYTTELEKIKKDTFTFFMEKLNHKIFQEAFKGRTSAFEWCQIPSIWEDKEITHFIHRVESFLSDMGYSIIESTCDKHGYYLLKISWRRQEDETQSI